MICQPLFVRKSCLEDQIQDGRGGLLIGEEGKLLLLLLLLLLSNFKVTGKPNTKLVYETDLFVDKGPTSA